MKKKRECTGILLLLFLCLTGGSLLRTEAAGSREFANVVIFAYFENGNTEDYYDVSNEYGDVKIYKSLQDEEFYQNETVKNALMKMYEGPEEYSVVHYLDKVSDGKFQIKNVFPQYDGTSIQPYAIQNTTIAQAKTENQDDMIIKEIMEHVTIPAGTLMDYDGDGCIDNLTVILRGGGKGVESTNGRGVPSLYAHKADFGGSDTWKNTGKRVSAFNMLNTNSVMESIVSSKSGVLIHEFLHTIGFPDLYTVDGAENPVYCWDIMASSSQYPAYPLAYMRMAKGKWMDESDFQVIERTTTSVTLDTQEQVNGNRACILKSPLNNEEFFVVEFRKKPKERVIDFYLGGSGIIVYRINPTVENLSNHGTGTGVYVFRPNGDVTQSGALAAFLSEECGRTGMGTADMTKTITDGAITFSNGENSGIVISNVGSAEGNQITFDVTVPNTADYDVWTNTKFADEGNQEDFGKNVVITSWKDMPYMAVYRNQQISLWNYKDNAWKQVGAALSCSYLSGLQLEVWQNALYLAYDEGGERVTVKKLSAAETGWEEIAAASGYDVSMKAMTDGLYVTYLKYGTGADSTAVLAKLEGNTLRQLAAYQTGLIGQPKLAESAGRIYVAARAAAGPVSVYEYQAGKTTKISEDALSANTYDLTGTEQELYVTLGGNTAKLTLYRYNGQNWSSTVSEKECYQPKLSVSQGNLYLLLIPDQNGSIEVVRYDAAADSFVEEGIHIDGSPSAIDFTSIEKKLYVAYVRQSDKKIYVKEKDSTAPETKPEPETPEPETPDTEKPETPDTEKPETPDTEKPETPGTEKPISNMHVNPPATKIKKLKAANKSVVVTWKTRKQEVQGYQLQIATNRKFRKGKTYTIKRAQTGKKKIRRLSGKKTCYVRIRTYKYVGKSKFYSRWSSIKRIKNKV